MSTASPRHLPADGPPARAATPSRGSTPAVLAAALALVLAVSLLTGVAVADISDTITVIKEDESPPSNVELVARLAEETFSGSTPRVLIGRDDDFADNMASAVMQKDAPLLLVPSTGPVPDRVADLLAGYDPEEVVLLGGERALSEELEAELSSTYTVVRRAGTTRFETAVDIAENEAPTADTAILARGNADASAADPTQEFADALAAGGWAASQGWPVLLTPTGSLPATVEAYLARSRIRNVMVMGGTAAISQEVEDRLGEMGITATRVAGANRFGTAIAVAAMRGVAEAADADRVVLVEGQAEDAWAGGFAAAAHSAAFDAPIVLANGSGIPSVTADFLSGPGATFAQDELFADAVLTCVTTPAACARARELRGLPAEATVTFSPADGDTPQAGTGISAQVSTEEPAQLTMSGDCIPTVTGSSPGTTSATITPGFTGACTVTVTVVFPAGSRQVEQATYDVQPGPQVEESTTQGILTGATAGARTYSWVPGAQEALVTVTDGDAFRVDGAAVTEQQFFVAASVGDLLVQRVRTVRQTTTLIHEITNRQPDAYTSGVVGDVDLAAGTAAIIEPVSGRALRAFPLASSSITVDGGTADQARLNADISEGDQVTIGVIGPGAQSLALTNGASTGPVVGRTDTSGGLAFRVGSGGLLTSPNRGDVPSGPENTVFVVPPTASSAVELTVNGAVVTPAQFRELLADGDQVSYTRTGGVERFALTGKATTSTVTGRATETHDVAVDGSMLLLVPGQGRIRQVITPGAALFVDNMPVDRPTFNAAYTGGDGISVTTPSTTAAQQVRLTTMPATGSVANPDRTARTYTITTPDGTLFQPMSYAQGTAPFRNGVTTHEYLINGDPVSQTSFESSLGSTGATVEVRPNAVNPNGLTVVQHRLTVQGSVG